MGCMGASGISLGVEFTKGQAGLIKEVSTNSSNWSEFLDGYIQFTSDYSNIRIDSTSERMTAYSAVANKISGSIEFLSATSVKNSDYIASSINNFKKEQRLGEQLNRTLHNYEHPFSSHKFNILLLETVQQPKVNNLNIEKGLALALALEPKLTLNTIEKMKALTFLNTEKPESDVKFIGAHLSKEILNSSLYHGHAKTLGVLFAQEKKQETIQDNKDHLKKLSALSLLLNAQVIKNTDVQSSISTVQYIASLNIDSYIDGSTSKANGYGLNLGISTTQALQNTLLNEYLTLKREKNALKAIVNM